MRPDLERPRGGLYFDTGCCQLIMDDKIQVRAGYIDAYHGDSVQFSDGSREDFEYVVFCTGECRYWRRS
jgi:hypothetical protein